MLLPLYGGKEIWRWDDRLPRCASDVVYPIEEVGKVAGIQSAVVWRGVLRALPGRRHGP